MSDIAAYQRQIVRITRERDEARTALRDVKERSHREARVAAHRIADGTSAALDAARIRLKASEAKNMRGKEAVQAANRRLREAEAAHVAERARMESDRTRLCDENRLLKDQLAALNRDIDRLAGERAESINERLEEERRGRGTDERSMVYWLILKDTMIMNACRYLSMTLGLRPEYVISMVLTWARNKDFPAPPKPTEDFLMGELGVTPDGWTARVLGSANDASWKRWGIKPDGAVSLDRAEAEGHPRIHPDYQPSWYGDSAAAAVPSRPDQVSTRRVLTQRHAIRSKR